MSLRRFPAARTNPPRGAATVGDIARRLRGGEASGLPAGPPATAGAGLAADAGAPVPMFPHPDMGAGRAALTASRRRSAPRG